MLDHSPRAAALLDFYKAMLADTTIAEGAVKDIKVSDYRSPNLPDGYDTVLGYLATHEPFLLSVMEEYAEATEMDDWWLTGRCKSAGIEPVKVPASLLLVREGVFEINSYPLEFLRERLSVEEARQWSSLSLPVSRPSSAPTRSSRRFTASFAAPARR